MNGNKTINQKMRSVTYEFEQCTWIIHFRPKGNDERIVDLWTEASGDLMHMHIKRK